MNFFSRKNLLGETQTVTCRIERDPVSGSFGLSLNDHNRITKVAKGSPSEKAKLIVFDRIIKVDGAPLDGPIKKFAEGKQALLLTVERPPKEMYRAIVDQENAEGSQAYSAPKPPPGPPPSAKAAEEGTEILTFILSKGPQEIFGLEVSPENVVLAVDADSAGQRCGLKANDLILKVDGAPLKEPISGLLAKGLLAKKASNSVALTVQRGIRLGRAISTTEHALHGEL